jgi:hypothetical protein
MTRRSTLLPPSRPCSNGPFAAMAYVAPALLGTLLATSAHAQDRREPQYRILELTDGRSLSLRTPQGDSLISFELLVDMQPTDAAGYEAQTDWVVYIAVDEPLMDAAMAMYKAVPGVSAHPVGSAVNGLSADAANAALQCNGELQCLVDALSGVGWMWVVTSDTTADGKSVLMGAVTQGRTRTNVPLDSSDRNVLWSGLHQAIGLAPPSKGPPAAVESSGRSPKASGDITPGKVTGLSFLPLPGVPAMAQKDWGNAGLAWGIALPSAALFFVGSAASQEDGMDFGNPGFLLTAAGGSYLSIVFANQVTGMRAYQKGKDRSVGLASMPLEGGGGALVVVK